MEYGDQPGIEDPARAIRNCQGTDALLMSRFMLDRQSDLMAGPEAPVPVVEVQREKWHPGGAARSPGPAAAAL